MATHLRALLLCVAILTGVSEALPQACVYVKNVELSQTPEYGKSSSVSYNFKNTNDYKVTVDATFILKTTEGASTKQTRTIVLLPGETRKVQFYVSNMFDKGYFSVTDSSVTFAVWKCD